MRPEYWNRSDSGKLERWPVAELEKILPGEEYGNNGRLWVEYPLPPFPGEKRFYRVGKKAQNLDSIREAGRLYKEKNQWL